MIHRIVQFALRQRPIVLVFAAVICVAGAIAFHNMPVDAYPDLSPPMVEVITQWPGHASGHGVAVGSGDAGDAVQGRPDGGLDRREPGAVRGAEDDAAGAGGVAGACGRAGDVVDERGRSAP